MYTDHPLHRPPSRSPRSRSTGPSSSTRSCRRCPTRSPPRSGEAVRDPEVKVIVLRGAGRAFCAGYDFGGGFEHWGDAISTDGRWDPGKDFVTTTAAETAPTQKFMALWRSPKPVIAQVHGWCVGGGSDFALCADLVIASEDAVIGTPYSRMWGAYLSGMWIYRLGLARTKFHALTGRPLNGRQAADVELINEAVPFDELEARVAELAGELAQIPSSQLAAMKLVVNQAYENMGLASSQTLGSILDGLMRNTPDALAFVDTAATDGVERRRCPPRRTLRRLQPGTAATAPRSRQRHPPLTHDRDPGRALEQAAARCLQRPPVALGRPGRPPVDRLAADARDAGNHGDGRPCRSIRISAQFDEISATSRRNARPRTCSSRSSPAARARLRSRPPAYGRRPQSQPPQPKPGALLSC